jgi:hypothetical protein
MNKPLDDSQDLKNLGGCGVFTFGHPIMVFRAISEP